MRQLSPLHHLALRGESPAVSPTRALAKLSRGCDNQGPHLVEGLGASLDSPSP